MRTTWPDWFPEVVIHADLHARDGHADYPAAKAGDADAALSLAIDLVADDAVKVLRSIVAGRNVQLLPVVAEEASGFNAIPDAMAQVLARRLGLEVSVGEVVQANKVGHTRAPAFQRIVTPAVFDGRSVPARITYSWTIMSGWAGRSPI